MNLLPRAVVIVALYSGTAANCAMADEQVNPDATPTAEKKDAGATKKNPVLTIKPVLLDTDKTTGTSLALDYAFNKRIRFWAPGKTTVDSDVIPEGTEGMVIRSGELLLLARGTIASSSAKTSNKLLDFSAMPLLVINTLPAYYKLGGTVTYETDQSREHKQTMYGAAGSFTKINLLAQGDGVTLMAAYGKVDPTADTERKKLLGTLDIYKRWNAELSYIIPIRNEQVRSIEFDYRHYQEVDAPALVKGAGLDRNKLGLIRVNLANEFFVEYSAGTLPFDQRTVRAVKVGWSLKLM
jgi:hypothetical protein